MKKRRLLAMFMGTVMALGTLAGCSGRNTPDDGGEDGGGGQNPPKPPVTDTQPIADAVDILEGTPYKSDEVKTNYGLSDAKTVGVDPEAANTELYPKKADGEFASGNIVKADDFTGTDEEKLTAAIASAKSKNVGDTPVKLVLPDRDITLTQPMTLQGFHGLWVEGGENSQLVIDCAKRGGWVGALRVNDCEEIHFNSVDIDYAVLPSITGIVTSSDQAALTVTMSIPESMRSTVAAYKTSGLGNKIKSLIEYNRFSNGPAENGTVVIDSDNAIKDFAFNGDSEITVNFNESYQNSFEAPVKNTPFAIGFAMYDAAGVAVSGGKNVYFEDCNLYSCPGMGVTVSSSENFYANRFNLTLKEDRRMTATADGYHVSLCTGDVKITNSVIENTHDDALNIKSGYWYTYGSHDPTAREFTFNRKTGNSPATEAGDTIELYSRDTFELLGTFTVAEAVSETSSQLQLKVGKRISGSVDWTSAMMTNVTKSARLTFKNNIVRNKRNRGILVQVRGAEIENNTFENVGHGSMQIASSMDIYNETTVPRDITVRNNKLINNGYLLGEGLRGDISAFAIASSAIVAPPDTVKNITIENNYISNSGNAGISFRGVGSTAVSNNLFYNVARVYASELTECCLELENCTSLTIKGNYNYNTNGSTTFSGIITGGVTRTEDITLESNVNLRYQEIDGEVPNTEVQKVASGTVTLDGNLSEWANIGSDIEILGASETTGDEVLRETYKDVFDVLTKKIVWMDEGIYIAFDIYDNKLVFKTVANFWEGDGVEIYMSTVLSMPNADFQLFKNQGDVLQLSCVPGWTVPYTVAPGRSNDSLYARSSEIQVKTALRSDGYSGEIFLPFSLFAGMKTAVDNGDAIAFGFIFMDADRDDIGRKRIQVANVPHFVEANKTKTAKMPTFTFVG